MGLTIRPVKSRSDLNKFIRLPFRLYRSDPNWVPPFLVEERRKFKSKTNPMLLHCDFELFLLFQDGQPVGRISAFVDRLALEHWKEDIGFFGSYECIENPDGARLLFETARDWLERRGMKRMRGPWSFASQEWGVVVKGFDLPPMIMAPHNFPYYSRQMESFGMTKAKDLMVYEVDCSKGYNLPERFLKSTDRIARENRVTIRPIDMRHLGRDVKTLVDVANASTRNNWGFIPVTDEEANDLARSMKQIVDPDIVMIAEVEGRPIGYLIALPDINVLTKGLHGRLFPLGIFKLLFGIKKIRQYRIWALGVIPEYQRRAIDTLFYRNLYDVLYPKGPTIVEANYVLEDNMAMNNPILKMGFLHVKTYRVYEMDIA